MDRVIQYIIALFVIIAAAGIGYLLFLAPPVTAPSAATAGSNDTIVYYFYGQGCPHCAKVEPFMANMTQKYPDLDIRMLEIWYNQTNQLIYTQANTRAGITTPPGVPEIVIGKTVLVGEIDIPGKLEGYLQALEKKK